MAIDLEKLELPKRLQDLEGTESELRAQKARLISKFGFAEFEKLVLRSQKSYQRKESK